MKEITEEDIWTDDSGLEWVNADQAKRMEEELLRLREEVKEKDKRIDELEQFNKRFAQEATLLDFRGSQLFTKEALQSKEEGCECGGNPAVTFDHKICDNVCSKCRKRISGTRGLR